MKTKNVQIIYNADPYQAAHKENKVTGDFLYRWISALTGEITIDTVYRRIINWPGLYVKMNDKLYLIKYSGKSGPKPWLDNILNK